MVVLNFAGWNLPNKAHRTRWWMDVQKMETETETETETERGAVQGHPMNAAPGLPALVGGTQRTGIPY